MKYPPAGDTPAIPGAPRCGGGGSENTGGPRCGGGRFGLTYRSHERQKRGHGGGPAFVVGEPWFPQRSPSNEG